VSTRKQVKRLDLLFREVQDLHAQENFFRLKTYLDNLDTSGGSLPGPPGPQGPPGAAGAPGSNGLSAYQIAVANGFVGTEQDWLDSLVGPPGPEGSTKLEVAKIAGETISAMKAVCAVSETEVRLSDDSDPTRAFALGVSRSTSPPGGPVIVVTHGILQDALFAGFQLNEPVFVGTLGTLTQTPPTSGFLIEIGKYIGQNQIIVEVKRIITL
jgi:hypothetical protein